MQNMLWKMVFGKLAKVQAADVIFNKEYFRGCLSSLKNYFISIFKQVSTFMIVAGKTTVTVFSRHLINVNMVTAVIRR